MRHYTIKIGKKPIAMTRDTNDFIQFLNSSPTPFHAVNKAIEHLSTKGFIPFVGDFSPGKYYYSLGDSSLFAFILPKKPCFFRLFSAHTDSPSLKLKHQPFLKESHSLQLQVEPYGGLIIHTWFDRDLAIAGMVYKNNKKYLVRGKNTFCKIPSLAIHLDRDVNKKGPLLDLEKSLNPIFYFGKTQSKEENLLRFI